MSNGLNFDPRTGPPKPRRPRRPRQRCQWWGIAAVVLLVATAIGGQVLIILTPRGAPDVLAPERCGAVEQCPAIAYGPLPTAAALTIPAALFLPQLGRGHLGARVFLAPLLMLQFSVGKGRPMATTLESLERKYENLERKIDEVERLARATRATVDALNSDWYQNLKALLAEHKSDTDVMFKVLLRAREDDRRIADERHAAMTNRINDFEAKVMAQFEKLLERREEH